MQMKEVAYSWKAGSQVPVDPQIAGERLEWIKSEHAGALTPQLVLDDARSHNSPLHGAFEWNDDDAASAYRLQQASYLIRSLVVKVKVEPMKSREMRAMVSVEREEKPHYVSRATALGDQVLRKQVVDRAWRELLSWRHKYADLNELQKILDVIDREAPKKAA